MFRTVYPTIRISEETLNVWNARTVFTYQLILYQETNCVNQTPLQKTFPIKENTVASISMVNSEYSAVDAEMVIILMILELVDLLLLL